MESGLDQAVRLLILVVQTMNSGPSYWGDAFSDEDYKEIVLFLKKYGINYGEGE